MRTKRTKKTETEKLDETSVKVTSTFTKYAYNILDLDNVINRSKRIERLSLQGLENDIDGTAMKSKLAKAGTTIRKLKEDRDKLNTLVGVLKYDLKKAKEDRKQKDKIIWDKTQY